MFVACYCLAKILVELRGYEMVVVLFCTMLMTTV